MTYVDSSVALAFLLAEPTAPPPTFWRTDLVSSRLLEYEVWNRIHVRGLGRALAGEIRALLAGIELIELTRAVLVRALEPWPAAVRTLDALHLATIEFLRGREDVVELASYDKRLVSAARELGIELAQLS